MQSYDRRLYNIKLKHYNKNVKLMNKGIVYKIIYYFTILVITILLYKIL